MKIIGLTGTIASGKSYICALLKEKGLKVFEADIEARKIIFEEHVLAKIKLVFPESYKQEKLDKNILSEIAFNSSEKLQLLEEIIHPEVERKRDEFIANNNQQQVIFIEAPLLFEAGYEKVCEKVIVVYTNNEIRKNRALQRENMTEAKLNNILKLQLSDEERKLRADYIIYNNGGKEELITKIDKILKEILEQ